VGLTPEQEADIQVVVDEELERARVEQEAAEAAKAAKDSGYAAGGGTPLRPILRNPVRRVVFSD